jgi:hypothetical protein
MFGFGFGELVVILGIVVVVFGSAKLPDGSPGDRLERLRREPGRPDRLRGVFRRQAPSWTVADWTRVVLAVAAAAAAIVANALTRS